MSLKAAKETNGFKHVKSLLTEHRYSSHVIVSITGRLLAFERHLTGKRIGPGLLAVKVCIFLRDQLRHIFFPFTLILLIKAKSSGHVEIVEAPT